MIALPFKAVRPTVEHASSVASRPYDVVSVDQARHIIKDNSQSFMRVVRPDADFPPSESPNTQQIYLRARNNLKRLLTDGIMCRDSQPHFYLYRITAGKHTQTGLVCLSSVNDYLEGRIKPHERTRPDKVRERTEHMEMLGAQVGPIFSFYHNHATLDSIIGDITSESPNIDFMAGQPERHQVFVISDAARAISIEQAFADIDSIYIADGHHRCEASAELYRRSQERNDDDLSCNHFLNVIFPSHELQVLPYNRVIKGLNDQNPDQLLQRISADYNLESAIEPVAPSTTGQFGLYLNGKWYSLQNREATAKDRHETDSAILTRTILSPILGLADLRNDSRIGFVGGTGSLMELEGMVDSHDYDIAFSLCPTTVEQLMQAADSGEAMPPKSTWFEPKLLSGLFVNVLKDELYQ